MCWRVGVDLKGREAAGASVLACAQQQHRVSRRRAVVEVLLAAGAQLGVSDVLQAVVHADIDGLHRLLRIGALQVTGQRLPGW